MPQLDTLTFINQFIWFIISFIGLYIYIENMVLPKLSMIFKARIWSLYGSKNMKLNEKNHLKDIITISNLNMIENYYNDLNSNSNSWLNNGINDIKLHQLSELDSTYISEVENIIYIKRSDIKE